jgi:hypothetical protein
MSGSIKDSTHLILLVSFPLHNTIKQIPAYTTASHRTERQERSKESRYKEVRGKRVDIRRWGKEVKQSVSLHL